MGLTVTLLSGPRRSGKSVVAGLLIEEVLEGRPHYLRLTAVAGGKQPPVGIMPPKHGCGVASAQWLCYAGDRVFEILAEALAAIHHQNQAGHVVIEADADPVLRHAYPYDRQVFVMRAPRALSDVFRSSVQAARALQDALDDTTEFAAEVFGLPHAAATLDDDTREERDLLSRSQIRWFLDSPLGDELASRIQLRPEYHGLIESDVVLVNVAAGGVLPAVVDGCCQRLERLLSRIQGPTGEGRPIFCCDPTDPQDPRRGEFIDTLKTLCWPKR
jgi:hypothetical protein